MSESCYIGIGVGACRAKLVVLSAEGAVEREESAEHLGDPTRVVRQWLAALSPAAVRGLAVTGRETGPFAAATLPESEAVEEALRAGGLAADLVLSLGGESLVAYPIGPDGAVLDHVAGNRCAAGTGEFVRQQLGRLNLTLDQAESLARQGRVVPMARRCSVHFKSDCTHALNRRKCTPADVVRTLCRSVAEKAAALVESAGVRRGRLLVTGGASVNGVILADLADLLPDFAVSVPPRALVFEAFGAAHAARRLARVVPDLWDALFRNAPRAFERLEPLDAYGDRVEFRTWSRGEVRPGGRYVLGVDGGSTTTKAALVDVETRRICAAHYTKTNGNPERALKECLAAMAEQARSAAGPEGPSIVGVGTTGSSGEFLSVLCGTPWYHNEIIAHACGATHFCPEVDTIFEIGGQDSKFTRLRARVPVDFNMNDSCAAGTGSFIEESAKDDLGVAMEAIAETALRGREPLGFSNQCAAFTNSDTRKAAQEGAPREDIVAGLAYAVASNYIAKVVAHRALGEHVVFQGGTSRNRAIALALAARSGRRITVPPDPELMGCFGIALWLLEKLAVGEAREQPFTFEGLLQTQAEFGREFTCRACDNLCDIQQIRVGGEVFPFGGRCNKWVNVRRKVESQPGLDLVARRTRLLIEEYGAPPAAPGGEAGRPVIGIPNIFSAHTLYPLFSVFFRELGFAVRLGQTPHAEGIRRTQSNQCYPYELAYGTFHGLVEEGVRRIFVPHVAAMPGTSRGIPGVCCPIAQAAPYVLSAAYRDAGIELLRPVLDMPDRLEDAEPAFLEVGAALGRDAAACRAAFARACERQRAFHEAILAEGRETLGRLARANETAVVLVGRPYNAFCSVTNLDVPQKFATSGVTVVPCDFLPADGEPCEETMYWNYGRLILKALRYTRRHENLFPVYISNFGCGPDSFLLHFARDILGDKPCLFLELDSHEADAGIMTRVSAFLDVVAGYRRLERAPARRRAFRPAAVSARSGKLWVTTSAGETIPLSHPRVTFAFPSMGRHNTEALAAVARRFGLNGLALPPADERVLNLGREFTNGKECVPAVLTIGQMMDYCQRRFRKRRGDEVLVLFMPTANGPCRFGQYSVYMRQLIRELELADVALCSLSAEDGYQGFGPAFRLAAWQAATVACLVADLAGLLRAAARDRAAALAALENEWKGLLAAFERGLLPTWRALGRAARALGALELVRPADQVPKVLLAGEIFVRCDELCCRELDALYGDAGIMLKRPDVLEWLYYTHWLHLGQLSGRPGDPNGFLGKPFLWRQLAAGLLRGDRDARAFAAARLQLGLQRRLEAALRRRLGRSGLVNTRQHRIEDVIETGADFISPSLFGEAILTVGASIESLQHSPGENYHGVAVIGPFNCMPRGVAESVLKPHSRQDDVPLLVVETDGSPLTPSVRSQVEVHIRRVLRRAAAAAGASPGVPASVAPVAVS
jgi:predicted CoA-substrate-specific enzyme activase